MKKLLAILALVIFVGGLSAPVIAANNSEIALISLSEDDPKKKETKDSKKSRATKSDAKSSECCPDSKKDCSSTKKGCESAEKSPCSKKCGDKG